MAIEHNTETVRRIFTDVNDDQRYELLDEILHPDVLIHDPISGDQRGIAAFRGLLAFFRQAFGEQRTDLQQFVVQGDFVVLLHTHHAKSTGSFLGAPPTNAWIVVPGIELFRFQDGKIAEFWRFDADIALLAQLGMLPMMQAA